MAAVVTSPEKGDIMPPATWTCPGENAAPSHWQDARKDVHHTERGLRKCAVKTKYSCRVVVATAQLKAVEHSSRNAGANPKRKKGNLHAA